MMKGMNSTEITQLKSENLAELNRKFGELKARAESIQVTDSLSFSEAGHAKLDVQGYVKAVKFATGPDIEIAKEVLRRLQEQEKALTAPADALLFDLERKRKEWANKEREAAAKEQERINEAARKEAAKNHEKRPTPITVKPSIPTVPGLRNTVNYKFEVVDATKVRKDWLIPDLVAIGQKVRSDKDPEQSMKEIGGIRAWKE